MDDEVVGRRRPAPRGTADAVAKWLEWAAELPSGAPVSICLPAYAGRVVVRTYEPYTCEFVELPRSDRWAIETALVPLTADVAAGHSEFGPVHPGDAVVYVGQSDGETEDAAWFPQRVLATEPSIRPGFQHVITLADLTVRDDGFSASGRWRAGWFDDVDLSSLFIGGFGSEPLAGATRRLVLELFDLNVDCAHCGARGDRIMWGMPAGPPGPHDIVGGCVVSAGDPQYACRSCGAEWRVSAGGELLLSVSREE